MTDPIDRYVEIKLEVLREQPAVVDLPTLLQQWGLSNSNQEQFWVIAYDSSEQIRTVVPIARGSYHSVDVHIPAVLAAVLVSGVDRFKVAHNHPTGDTNPTLMDVDLTRTIMRASNAAGLSFDDHYIVGPRGGMYSLAAHGLLIPNPDLEAQSRNKHKIVTL